MFGHRARCSWLSPLLILVSVLSVATLWFVATGLGQSVQRRMASGDTSAVAAMHWIRTLVVIGLLVLMVWKPGA